MARTHGNASTYARGCRCEPCREANTDKQREYFRRIGGNPNRTWYDRTCLACGREYMTTVKQGKYCSNACQAAHEHGPDRRPKDPAARRRLARWEHAERKLAAAAEGNRGKYVFVAGRCARCGKSAVSNPGSKIGEIFYCSARCRRWERSVLRQRGGRVVNRQAIYARDGYRCQIPQCIFRSRKVDMTKAVPHPRSAVLDHVIPLVEWPDGTVPENLRTAHFQCNSLRSDKGSNDQLMLIG